ncbi:cold shock domain-containing protein [Actinomadura fulvescens]|uniref:Cold shock domain-containing protein n=1 Tax=Actinomadura fulvescens TaxID=46160 RepID=A0ABN3QEU3_9ACTN
MAEFGRILQFDEARGYGFIAPDTGGADVFVHVNECEGDQLRFTPGTRVRFEVMDGGRGKKAYDVSIVTETDLDGAAAESAEAKTAERDDDGGFCYVLSAREMRTVLTEMLLESAPELTGAQIVRLRDRFLALSRKHGWAEG